MIDIKEVEELLSLSNICFVKDPESLEGFCSYKIAVPHTEPALIAKEIVKNLNELKYEYYELISPIEVITIQEGVEVLPLSDVRGEYCTHCTEPDFSIIQVYGIPTYSHSIKIRAREA